MSYIRDILWKRQWHPTPVLLPGKSHGWRSLVGCSPWGRKESDMTERLHFHFIFMHWRRNGNPLQCSCLENPRDGGAWWAAVYGVAQSRTRLKWLRSSSSRYTQDARIYKPIHKGDINISIFLLTRSTVFLSNFSRYIRTPMQRPCFCQIEYLDICFLSLSPWFGSPTKRK